MSDIRAVKRNISMQHWAAIIADRNTTDLTVKEYCTRNNLSRNSYFYWLRQLRQEATDSLDLKSLTKNTVRQEENCIVELLPSGKKEMVAPEFIQEDETAGKSEGDSLKISIGDIDSKLSLVWNLNRLISKMNYRVHTDAIKEKLIPPVLTRSRFYIDLPLIIVII